MTKQLTHRETFILEKNDVKQFLAHNDFNFDKWKKILEMENFLEI